MCDEQGDDIKSANTNILSFNFFSPVTPVLLFIFISAGEQKIQEFKLSLNIFLF